MSGKILRMKHWVATGLALCAITATAVDAQHKPKPKPAPTPSTPYKPWPKKTPSPCDRYFEDMLFCATWPYLYSCPNAKPPGC